MSTEGYIQGASGEEISVLVDNVKLMAVQNLSWKVSQSKTVIRGAGHRKAHAIGRGPKEYELDMEVKELNNPVLETSVNAARSAEVQSTVFKIGDQEFSDILDLRNCTVLIVYPVKNGFQRVIRFTGVEFTDNEGGFAFDDESVGRKLSCIAMSASGLV